MSAAELEKLIREYLTQVVHLSLATAANNQPWVCEVHFAYDEGLNLYFISQKDTRHGQEISQSPLVAGSIVTQHHKHQKVRGVYFEGRATALTDVDKQNSGYKVYVERLGGWDSLLQDVANNGKAALYKIAVEDFYMFDNYETGRGKLHLSWGSAA